METYIELLLAEANKAVAMLDSGRYSRSVVDGRCSRHDLASWYANACYAIRDSAELLEKAAMTLWKQGTMPMLAELLTQKVEEERNHHRWCIQDLEVLGFSRRWLDHVKPVPAVHAYLTFNRGLCEWRPAGFAGTAFVLEFLATKRARQIADNLIARSGIPYIEQAVSFLSGHAGEDEGHVQEMLQLLSECVTDNNTMEVICAAANMTRLQYPGFFEPVRLLARRLV